MGGLEFVPYDQKATTAFFKAKEEEAKREAERAKKGGKGGKGGQQKGGAGGAAAPKKPAAKEESKGPAPKAAPASAQAQVIVPPQASFEVNPRHDSLEVQLANNQWLGGQKLSKADHVAFEEIKATPPRAESHPNTFAWYAQVGKFKPEVRQTWKGEAVIPAPVINREEKKAPAAAAEDDIDEDDLFGDGGDDDGAAAEALKKKG